MIIPALLKSSWVVMLASISHKNSKMEESYDRLTKKLETKLAEKASKDSSPYWIGVAGGPGSGKTTVANEVCSRLNEICPDSAIVIGMDGWHVYQERLVEEFGKEEGMQRRGAPWTFDFELFFQDLTKAKETGKSSLPDYCREISDPVPNRVQLEPHHKIVFVEGIYLLWKDDENWGKLFDFWDETWFVECPSRDDQIERIVARSLKTWSDQKAKMWGEGRGGAMARVKYNDLKNSDMVSHMICRFIFPSRIQVVSYFSLQDSTLQSVCRRSHCKLVIFLPFGYSFYEI